jgi:Cof subfamily protein (haloacid dehalogenase superfamily)
MKWWFSDYDGTINVNHNDIIEQQDLEFINEWIDDGNKLVIATGRMNHEILGVLKQNAIPFDYLVMNNGACVYDKSNNLISHLTIPMAARKEIVAILTEWKDRFAISYCIENTRTDLTSVYTKEIEESEFLRQYAPHHNNFAAGIKDIETNKDLNIIYFYVNKGDIEEIKNRFHAIPGLKAVRTVTNVIEVMNADVSKAHGIKIIEDMHNLDSANIFTSGDGENDIEMLAHTKHSFAMDTADDVVKKTASHVIARVRDIKKYL